MFYILLFFLISETVHYHPAPDIGAPDLRQEADGKNKTLFFSLIFFIYQIQLFFLSLLLFLSD